MRSGNKWKENWTVFARYSLITTKIKVPGSERELRLWCLLHMIKCIFLKWCLCLAAICTRTQRAGVQIRGCFLIVFWRVCVNEERRCWRTCSCNCVSLPEVWLQLSYGMFDLSDLGVKDRTRWAWGSFPRSLIADYAGMYIPAVLAVVSFCRMQFAVSYHGDLLYIARQGCRLMQMYLLRRESQSSQSVFTL